MSLITCIPMHRALIFLTLGWLPVGLTPRAWGAQPPTPQVVDAPLDAHAKASKVDAAVPLAAGDLIRFDVFEHPDLALTIRVPVSGRFAFPLIGDVTGVIGRPVDDVVSEIRRRLEADYLRRADMNGVVMEFAPRKEERIYVLGQVRNPNAQLWLRDDPPTVSRAISVAGGFDVSARRDQINLLRRGTVTVVDINAVLSGVKGAVDPVLEPGDQVLVPTQDRVYIMGRVKQVGAFALPVGEKLTVSKAVIQAGGFDEFARQDQVQLIRNGVTTEVDVKAIVAGRGGNDPVLEAGDTIMIPESRF